MGLETLIDVAFSGMLVIVNPPAQLVVLVIFVPPGTTTVMPAPCTATPEVLLTEPTRVARAAFPAGTIGGLQPSGGPEPPFPPPPPPQPIVKALANIESRVSEIT